MSLSLLLAGEGVMNYQDLSKRVADLIPKWQMGPGATKCEWCKPEDKCCSVCFGFKWIPDGPVLEDLKLNPPFEGGQTEPIVYLGDCYMDESECSSYFNYAQWRYDFEKMLKEDLPDCEVRVYWQANEVEIDGREKSKV